MFLQVEIYFVLKNTRRYVLEVVPQRCSPKNVFCNLTRMGDSAYFVFHCFVLNRRSIYVALTLKLLMQIWC